MKLLLVGAAGAGYYRSFVRRPDCAADRFLDAAGERFPAGAGAARHVPAQPAADAAG